MSLTLFDMPQPTPRGGALDHQWWTPEWASTALVERHFADLGPRDFVVEPCAGRGAFLKPIPAEVPAMGIEVDPLLASIARQNTGREVICADFSTVTPPAEPTMVLSNPPFVARTVDALLDKAREWMPHRGKCGLLLPAYAFQTPTRVLRWGEHWSLSVELVPRTLFMRSRLPLVFAVFERAAIRVFQGLALYRECAEVTKLRPHVREALFEAPPRRGVWRAVVESSLTRLGGRATLKDLYASIGPRRPTENQWWQEKVRQVVQQCATRVGPGEWRLS